MPMMASGEILSQIDGRLQMSLGKQI